MTKDDRGGVILRIATSQRGPKRRNGGRMIRTARFAPRQKIVRRGVVLIGRQRLGGVCLGSFVVAGLPVKHGQCAVNLGMGRIISKRSFQLQSGFREALLIDQRARGGDQYGGTHRNRFERIRSDRMVHRRLDFIECEVRP